MKTESKIILIISIIVGAFLRIYNIGFQCLWTEEQYTLKMASLPFHQIVSQSFSSDFNPPLYYFAAHIFFLLTNGLNYSIRYPSVICGILLIPTMFYLGLTYKDELTGLYCAIFTTILLPLIYYSQYGRAYEMSVLCFVIALIFYIRIKDGDNHISTHAAFWFMSVINVYVHLFSLIPIGLMCLDMLFDRRDYWSMTILSTLASLPLISMLVSVLHTRNGVSYNYGASIIQMIVLTPTEFFNTLFLNIFFLGAIGLWMDKNKLKIRLTAITIITLIVGTIASIYTPFFPRYFMTVSMIIMLFAAVACVELTKIINKKVNRNLDYILLVAILFIFVIMEYSNLVSHYTIVQYIC